jgi:hypothetical protein
MFLLSHVVIYLYVFTVLLNFFYFKAVTLSSSVETFTSCKECVNSNCFTTNACVIDPNNSSKFMCFKCDNDGDGRLYFFLDNCQKDCLGSNHQCVCKSQCYGCVNTTIVDLSDYKCDEYPNTQVDANCQSSPYPPPTYK